MHKHTPLSNSFQSSRPFLLLFPTAWACRFHSPTVVVDSSNNSSTWNDEILEKNYDINADISAYAGQMSRKNIQYKKIVTRTMSVSWQNRRHGQSLVANRKSEVKKIKRL